MLEAVIGGERPPKRGCLRRPVDLRIDRPRTGEEGDEGQDEQSQSQEQGGEETLAWHDEILIAAIGLPPIA